MSEKKEASHPQKQYKEAPEESDHLVEEKEHYEEEEDRVSVNIDSLPQVNYFSRSLASLFLTSLFFLFTVASCASKAKEKVTQKEKTKAPQ